MAGEVEEFEVVVANEFAEVHVAVVRTPRGVRLHIREPRSGRHVSLCPLELEALTWQTPDAFSAMLRAPMGPESGE